MLGGVPTGAAEKRLSARVSRVSRLCPIFRAQPGAYPPEAPKPDVAPTCGRTGNSTEAQRSGFGRKRKCGGMDETCRLQQMREHAETGKIERFWTPRRESRIKGWRRNRRFSCSQQPAVRTVSRGCAGAAIGACLEKNKCGWHQKSRKRRRFKGFRRATPQIGGL